LKNYFFCKIN